MDYRWASAAKVLGRAGTTAIIPSRTIGAAGVVRSSIKGLIKKRPLRRSAARRPAMEPRIPDHLQALVPALPQFFSAVLERLDAQDGWNPLAVHPSDLGAVLPVRDGSPEGCPRRVYLRTHGFEGNPKSDGTRLLLETAKDRHVTLETLLGNHRYLLSEMFPGWELAGVEEAAGEEGGEGTLDILLRCTTSAPCGECGGKGYTWTPPDSFEVGCVECGGSAGYLDNEIRRGSGKIESSILLVVDVKTMNGSGFVFLKKEGRAKPANKIQVQKYMKAKGADLGVCLYVDREGSAFMWQSPAFGRDDALVSRLWAELEERCGPQAEIPPPPLAPVIKKGQALLPWICEYYDKAGEPIRCSFLDTPHCAGALPPAQRPQTVEIWTRRVVPAKPRPWTPEGTAEEDLSRALLDSVLPPRDGLT
jgi:hypothetical protein